MRRWFVGWMFLIVISNGASAAARSVPVPEEEFDRDIQLTFLDTLNRGSEVSFSSRSSSSPAEAVEVISQQQFVDASDTQRFRIQIVASTQAEMITREKENLQADSSIPLVIVFDDPFYKLFAGQFSTRAEAESKLPQVRNLGYEDAWIVDTGAISN
ncbi:hypothetical protein CHISP_3378 [Chitinispirillum alkaliphilum]|nr:hypothetical protein CHISP_3378 [Chitinispirillum alkaliphilum]